jgi:feruloyl esterase
MFDRFIGQNRKLLIYHGLRDPALTAIRSVSFYEDLAQRTEGGYPELQKTVRMLLVPGMHHCSGRPGPNTLDTPTALENWVEHGVGPDGIVATKFVNDNPTSGVSRTMPL